MLIQTQNTKHKTQTLAWQGWSLSVPVAWNPVKVDGDYAEGSLLLADLHSARLGLRWKKAGRRGDRKNWAERALQDEVGKLAAQEAVDYVMPTAGDWSVSKLYKDPEPPGRDVWVGHCLRSGRLLQVVHHAEKRGTLFTDALLPSLIGAKNDEVQRWSIFDLSFETPVGVGVQWYRFNAGDLAVGLQASPPPLRGRVGWGVRASSESHNARDPSPYPLPQGEGEKMRGVIVIRQIGPAKLALTRQTLAGWLTQLPTAMRRLYRPIDKTEPTTLDIPGRTLEGLRGSLQRKRRLSWAWMVTKRQTVLAFHDTDRDRLITGQAENEETLRSILATVGWNAVSQAEDE